MSSTSIPFPTPSSSSDEINSSQYGYNPTLWICAIFVSLYALSLILHIGQATYYRLWWLFPTVILAGFGETLGWVGRLWSAKNPPLRDPFMIQIATTIIAPTPLVAANFIILGKVIQYLGTRYSRLSPKWYMTIFLTCDIVALVIQAIGGGAAAAAPEDNPKAAQRGGNIMLAGIIFQLAAICVYATLAAEFLIRYTYDRPVRVVQPPPAAFPALTGSTTSQGEDKEQAMVYVDAIGRPKTTWPLRQMLGALVFSTLVIFIRSVYRVIELGEGWNGRVIHTQTYFNVLDGAMITLAMYTLNVFHPGRLLHF